VIDQRPLSKSDPFPTVKSRALVTSVCTHPQGGDARSRNNRLEDVLGTPTPAPTTGCSKGLISPFRWLACWPSWGPR